MNAPMPQNSGQEPAAVSDKTLLLMHEKLLGRQPDDQAHYRLMPLNLLFFLSGLIFLAGTYLNRYSGHFDPRVFNENLIPVEGAPMAAAPIDPVEMGRKLYNNAACNTCHQATGLGLPGAFPPLVGTEWVNGSEERIIRLVLHGIQGPISVNGVDYNSAMPAFGRVAGSGFNWSDDRIAAVLTYIRQEWGNSAGAISAEKVTEIRNQEGADKKPWTAPELLALP
jgi:mono/diheme cytochrome c family protein